MRGKPLTHSYILVKTQDNQIKQPKKKKPSLVQIRFFAMQKNQSTRIQAQNPPPIKELL